MHMHNTVGIDVSKATLDVAIRTNAAAVISKTATNSERGITSLISWLSHHAVNSKTPIVIESTGSYHWRVCVTLTEHNFTVHLINPLLTKQYQKATIRDTKTDRIDAIRLAEIASREASLPVFCDTPETLAQKRYLSLLAKVTTIQQQLHHAYTNAQYACEEVHASIDTEPIEASLKALDDTKNALKRSITSEAPPLAHTLAEIRGVSLFQATVLLSAISGKQFRTRDQLVAFFGLDVRQRRSGTWCGKEHISKRGNAFYRKVLFQLGWSLVRNNPEYHAYYEQIYTKRGKHYYTAIIATARKFLRYFFSVLPPEFRTS